MLLSAARKPELLAGCGEIAMMSESSNVPRSGPDGAGSAAPHGRQPTADDPSTAAVATQLGADTPQPFPLLVTDPPKIGDFWLDARLTASETGVVYFAHADDQPSVLLLMLNSGAAHDAAARDRLAGEVNKLHSDTVIARGGQGQNTGRLAGKFRSELDDPVPASAQPIAPWVALAYDASPAALAEADRLLRAVDLSRTPALGAVSGPGYDLPWRSDASTGHWRVWPLTWPGRHDRAGWVPLAVSWLFTVLLAALALLIAVLLFQNAPPEQPQPPVGTLASEDPNASSSASPIESSASASPSPSEGEHESPSKDPSMQSTGEESASASGSPSKRNERL